MHNDAQQCNGAIWTGPCRSRYSPVTCPLRASKFLISIIQDLMENKVLISTFRKENVPSAFLCQLLHLGQLDQATYMLLVFRRSQCNPSYLFLLQNVKSAIRNNTLCLLIHTLKISPHNASPSNKLTHWQDSNTSEILLTDLRLLIYILFSRITIPCLLSISAKRIMTLLRRFCPIAHFGGI